MNLKEAIRIGHEMCKNRHNVINPMVQSDSCCEALLTLISNSEKMSEVGDVIAEEKAKWADVEPDNKFGVGVKAGIEAVEYRLREKGVGI